MTSDAPEPAAHDAGASDVGARGAPPATAPSSVVALLALQADVRPDALALVEGLGRGRRTISFAALDREARRMQGWLESRGLARGDALLVFHQPTIDLYVLLVALFRMGATAMFVDLGAGRPTLEAACEMHRPAAVLLSPRAQLLRLVSPALRRIPLVLAGGRWPIPGAMRITRARAHPPVTRPPVDDPDVPALVTFTSGSTGTPRVAVRTHAFLRAQHRALASTFGAGAGQVDLVAFPVVVLANLASGATTVLPEADLRRPGRVDAHRLLTQLATERPARISAPPAMLARLVGACTPRDPRWASVREIVTGGGPVFPDLLAALARVAPRARRHAVYGSTEAEPIAHLEASTIGEADVARMAAGGGLPAGPPVSPVELRIVSGLAAHADVPSAPTGSEGRAADARDVPRFDARDFDARTLPPGVPGEIVVTGDHVLRGYWRGIGDAETKLCVGDAIWHRTGDIGLLDADGRLWLLGRAGAAIADARGTAYPFAAECALRLRWPGLRSALVAHRGARVLVVERAGPPDDAALRAAVPFAMIDAVVRVRRLPLDGRHESKIDYPRLRAVLDGVWGA